MAAEPAGDTGPIDPDAILRHPFASVKRGYDPLEVQNFLMSVAGELRAARDRQRELERDVAQLQRRLGDVADPTPTQLTALLGEEMTRVLDAANEAAAEIGAKADAAASAALEQARGDAQRMRVEASTVLERRTAEAEAAADEVRSQVDGLLEQAKVDADAEVEAGRQRGRDMVAEAQEVRERMLRDLARRRKGLRQQIEQLQAGRERLLAAYQVVRQHLDEVSAELSSSLPEARLAAEEAGARLADDSEAAVDRELAELTSELDLIADELPEPGEDGAAAEIVTAEEVADGEQPPPASEGPRAPDPVEGRKSSAVKVVRTGEHPVVEVAEGDETSAAPEPPAEAPQPEPAAEQPAAPSPPEPPQPAPGGGSQAKVAGLFARIKEESTQLDDVAGPAAELAEASDAGADAVADEIELVDADVDDGAGDDPRQRAVAELERTLARRLKRELSDEQNELLDAVRRHKKAPAADEVLPAGDTQIERYSSVSLAALAAAATAGGELVGVPPAEQSTRVSDLGADIGTELVSTLRERIEASFEADDDDTDALVERLRAAYREVKAQGVDGLVARSVRAAFDRGAGVLPESS